MLFPHSCVYTQRSLDNGGNNMKSQLMLTVKPNSTDSLFLLFSVQRRWEEMSKSLLDFLL